MTSTATLHYSNTVGEFGIVHKGHLLDSEKKVINTVAIKTPKGERTGAVNIDMLFILSTVRFSSIRNKFDFFS